MSDDLSQGAAISDAKFNRFDEELIDRYFNDDGKKAIQAYANQALTAYKQELLSKAIPVAALRVKDKEFEQIQAIPLSAIQEDVNQSTDSVNIGTRDVNGLQEDEAEE